MAGKGEATSFWIEIERLLQEQRISFKMLESYSEEVTRDFIAKHLYARTIRAVGIIGGDGTTSSIIQDLAKKDVPIAIFPAGSGNDTARMFHLTNNPAKFVSGLVANQTTSIDLIKANERFGLTIVGVGIDSIIGNRANNAFYKPMLNKLKLGSFTYSIAAVISILTFEPFNTNISIDGQNYTLRQTWLIACGNTTSYGGGLTICPQALPTDGELNLTMLHGVRRWKILIQLFPMLLRGQPIHKKGVTYKKGTEIVIHTDRPIPAIIDGEICTSTPLTITVHRKALKIVLTN